MPGRRHHVSGQRLPHPGGQPLDRRGRRGLGGDERREVLPARGVVPGEDDRLGQLGMGFQPGLHFAELDPEAADLHLVVAPAEIFDLPVLAEAREVARAVEPAARLRGKVDRAQSAPP